MCGIFGFQLRDSAVEEWQVRVLAGTLGVLNDNRGGHSWGIVSVKGTVEVKKGLGELAKSLTAAEIACGLAVMGHTRYASTGEVTIQNAHPFDVGTIIGAHNGIVGNHKELNERYQRTCAVDSEHIFLHLKENRSLAELEVWGAIQLVKPDQPESFYVGRFPSGDLAICGVGESAESARGVVWSSDRQHLLTALRVAGIPFFEYQVDPTELYEVSDGQLHRGKRVLKTTARRSFIDRPRHPKMSSTHTQATGGLYDDWLDWGEDDGTTYDEECEMCAQPTERLITVGETRMCRECLDRWAE